MIVVLSCFAIIGISAASAITSAPKPATTRTPAVAPKAVTAAPSRPAYCGNTGTDRLPECGWTAQREAAADKEREKKGAMEAWNIIGAARALGISPNALIAGAAAAGLTTDEYYSKMATIQYCTAHPCQGHMDLYMRTVH